MATVAIFLNCGPLLTVILASLLWPSEKVTIGIMIKVVAAFIGVLMITLGAPDTLSDEDSKIRRATGWFDYILLALMPLFVSVGNLAMGDLRTLDSIIIPFYSTISLFVISFIGCLANGKGFFPNEIEVQGYEFWWLISCVVSGISYLISWIFKVVGYKYDRVTRVSPIFYMESGLALIVDIAVFKVYFTTTQIIGLAIIIICFLTIILKAYLVETNNS